jgi:CubicO group peptidase (beta-lactamase class C family)
VTYTYSRQLMRWLAPLLILMLMSAPLAGLTARAQDDTRLDPAAVEVFLDGVIAAQMSEYRLAGVTVAVVQDDDIVLAKGYGTVDPANQTPVDPAVSMFRIGSITKTFIWTAVMQLVEQGLIDLDADVNIYLDFEIPGEPITMLDLMAHAPGFDDPIINTNARTVDDLQPLADWLPANIPAQVRAPGSYSSYSNYGAALAGYIVERVSGMAYEEYLAANIFEPLGMTHSAAYQARPEDVPGQSPGFLYQAGQYQSMDYMWFQGGPAGVIVSSAEDMARYMIAHLQDGRYGEARILEESTARQMHTPHFGVDERLGGWAHGFMLEWHGDDPLIGHGGDTGYFHSNMMLYPAAGVGLFVSYNSAESVGLPAKLTTAFFDHFFPLDDPDAAPAPVTDPATLAGTYRFIRYSHDSIGKMGVMLGMIPTVSISAGDDGALVASTPDGVIRMVEVAPLIYRAEDGSGYFQFAADDGGRIDTLYANSALITMERLAWYETNGFNWLLLVLAILLILSGGVAAVGGVLWRRYNGLTPDEQPALARIARAVIGALVVAVLVLVALVGLLAGDPLAIMVDVSAPMIALGVMSLVILALTAAAVVFAVLAWWRGFWRIGGRVHYTLVTLGAVGLVWFMIYWNMLGFRF